MAVGFSTTASAALVLGQWNANNRSNSTTFLAASSGTNAASGLAAGEAVRLSSS